MEDCEMTLEVEGEAPVIADAQARVPDVTEDIDDSNESGSAKINSQSRRDVQTIERDTLTRRLDLIETVLLQSRIGATDFGRKQVYRDLEQKAEDIKRQLGREIERAPSFKEHLQEIDKDAMSKAKSIGDYLVGGVTAIKERGIRSLDLACSGLSRLFKRPQEIAYATVSVPKRKSDYMGETSRSRVFALGCMGIVMAGLSGLFLKSYEHSRGYNNKNLVGCETIHSKEINDLGELSRKNSYIHEGDETVRYTEN